MPTVGFGSSQFGNAYYGDTLPGGYITVSRGGTNSDYQKYIFGKMVKTDQLNSPTLLDFTLVPVDGSFVKLQRGDYLQVNSLLYNTRFFTGFITNDAELEYLGTSNHTPVWGYKYQATDDSYILSLNPVGITQPFINTTMGAIIRSLAERLCPGVFDTVSVEDGPRIARYVVDPTKRFYEIVRDFATSAQYKFYAGDKSLFFVPQDSLLEAIAIDGSSKHFSPQRLSLAPSKVPVINDVIVLGNIEPQNPITEYFLGDGLTARYPLLSSVYGVDRSVLLDDVFTGDALDENKWAEYDTVADYIQLSNGYLNVLGGDNDTSISAYVQSAKLVPIEGNLKITHGEFDFVDDDVAHFTTEGYIGGLWTETPNASCTGCLYALRVQKDRGNTLLSPVINGTVDSVQTVDIDRTKRYIIRTLVSVADKIRYSQTWGYLDDTGVVSSRGTSPTTSAATFTTLVTEVDPSDGSITNTWQLSNVDTVSADQLWAYYVPVASNNLHCTMTGVTISVPMQATLAIKENGASSYVEQHIGPNEIDAMDGLTPIATIVDANNGAITKSSLLGTSQYNPGNAALQFFKDSTKQTSQVPQVGDLLRLRYRRAGAAIARVQDLTSVNSEASIWGDTGFRSMVLRDLTPSPRNSSECEEAAAAIIQDKGYQHYEGSFSEWSDYFLSNPMSGFMLRFSNLPAGMPSISVEEVSEVVTSFEARRPTERFYHTLTFGHPDVQAKVLAKFAKQEDVFQPEDTAQLPTVLELEKVGTTYIGDVLSPIFSSWNSTDITIDTGQAAPVAGGFEVRYTDDGWGTDDGRNLIVRTTSQTFSVPRTARGKACFIKAFGADNFCIYSEDFTNAAWVKTSAAVTNAVDTNPDANHSVIATAVFSGSGSISQDTGVAANNRADATFTIDLKGTPGDHVTLAVNASVSGLSASRVVTLTGNWQRESVTYNRYTGEAPLPDADGTLVVSVSSTSTTVKITRASLENTAAETSYYKTLSTPYGAQSRFASAVRVSFPLVPTAPTATFDVTDASNPIITVVLPVDEQDVWGVEVRASDNTTVLYSRDLADSDFLPTYTVAGNTARSLSFYVYTYNLLGEYSSAYHAAYSITTPTASGVAVDEAASLVTWSGSAATYTVLISPNADYSSPTVNQSTTDKSWALSAADLYETRYIKITPNDALGSGTPATTTHAFSGANLPFQPVPSGGIIEVENGNFEASSAIPPPGWYASSSTLSYVAGGSQQSGTQSLQITTSTTNGGVLSVRRWKVQPGELYRLTCWVKTTSSKTGQAVAAFYDASNSIVGTVNGSTTSGTYVFLSAVGTVPSGAVSAQIILRVTDSGGGTAVFDNVTVTRIYDPATDDVAKRGSMPPFFCNALTYTSTDSSITWSWTINGVRTDSSLSTFTETGSQAITGLSSSTTYNFYPFWDENTQSFSMVTTGGTGTPSWAHVGSDRMWSAEQARQDHVPLSGSPMQAATAAPASTGGGSSGGDGGCLLKGTLVRERVKGVIPCEELQVGDYIWSEGDSWLRVRNIHTKPHDLWVRAAFNNGASITVTAGHPFTLRDRTLKRAYQLSISDELICPTGMTFPVSLEFLDFDGSKVPIECAFPHTFFASTNGEDWILTHNMLPEPTI